MIHHKLTRRALSFCLLAASALMLGAIGSTTSTVAGQQGSSQSSKGADAGKTAGAVAREGLTKLQASSQTRVEAQVSRATGNYNFVRAAGGEVLAAAEAKATPKTRALSFLAEHGGMLGINEAEREALSRGGMPASGSDLRIAKTETDAIGITHVRMNQFYHALPVFGAQVIVHMNEAGITAVNGNFVSGVAVNGIPALTAARAREIALTSLRKDAGNADLEATKAELSVYPMGLLEGRPVQSRLAYGVEVSGKNAHEQVWIDAQNGLILNRIPLRHTALNRTIYSPQYDPDNPDLFVQRREGDPPHPTPFVNNLYDFAGQTYNFYASGFGRDSYDGLGIKMLSVYLINEQCPNAYWNGESTNYCPAFDADDVVSHEWSHAYTQFTHDLIYAYQSGALNESYSDIFGEAVDLLNNDDGIGGDNNEEPFPDGQRWLVGEDLGEEVQQLLLRDMYDPDRLAAPGKVSSPNYFCGNTDGGGVHTNSGVPNHGFALVVDGTKFKPADEDIGQAKGTYNGQTITGIGLTKASAIYYRAESVYQMPTTGFPEHDTALQTSCSDLTGKQLRKLSTTSAAGVTSGEVITAADCQQVAKAMLAVEMSAAPACSFGPLLNPDAAPLCAAPGVIFSEDWESGEDGWTKTSEGYLTGLLDWEQEPSKANTRFFKVTSALPGGRTGSAAFADDPQIGEEGGGTCTPGGDYSGSHTLDSPEIVIPAGATAPLLVFDHYVATETGVDGGQVEISRNGGAFTLLPRSEYVFNAPNSKFTDPAPVGNNTGPNPSEDAWTGTNLGGAILGSWGTTVADLSSVAQPGDTIQIRYIWSQDGCNGVEGWFIDNIRVLTCPVLKAPVLSTGNDYEDPDTDGSFTLEWTRPAGASGPDLLQVSQTSCAPLIFDNADNGLANWTSSTSGTGAQEWTTSEAKPQHTSPTFFVQGVEGVMSADSFLTYKNPITIPGVGQTFLNFSDWDNNEGDDNVLVEASEDNGKTWVAVYLHNRSEAGTGPVSFASEPLFQRSVNLANFGGKTIRLRFHYSLGAEDRAASTPFGWYVDDIAIVNDNWVDVASTAGTSLPQTKASGTYCYRVRTAYKLNGETALSPFSNIVSVEVAPGVANPAKLLNLSTRLRVLPGDNALIGGIIVTGAASKSVLFRGLGPSLSDDDTPITGRMSNPTLELHGKDGPIASNDDWKESQQAAIQATGIPPSDDRESALVRTLTPGEYTVILRGKNDEIGIALVEAYDLNQAANSTLANISTRGLVEVGDDVMIGGFISGPEAAGRTDILLRAIGPSLAQAGIADPLADPVLEVFNANGAPIAENDDWKDSQRVAIQATGVAPSNDAESAILLPALAPGHYTAIVRGKANTSGVGLVEVFNLQ